MIVWILIIVLVLMFLVLMRTDFLIEVERCGTTYLVLDSPNAEHSAELLCQVNHRVNKFLVHLDKIGHPGSKILRDVYDDDKIVESSDSAYTINKASGHFDKIHLCLQRDGRYFDIDTLMFVVIHELTHVMRNSFDFFDDHPADFWHDNKRLLLEAEKAGVMTNINYSVSPVHYCEKLIQSNPVYMI